MQDSILVTGASSGIGRAIAVRLAEDGYTIAVHYGSNRQGASDTLDAIKAVSGDGRLLSFDISNADETRKAIETDIEQHTQQAEYSQTLSQIFFVARHYRGHPLLSSICSGAAPATSLSDTDFSRILFREITGGSELSSCP